MVCFCTLSVHGKNTDKETPQATIKTQASPVDQTPPVIKASPIDKASPTMKNKASSTNQSSPTDKAFRLRQKIEILEKKLEKHPDNSKLHFALGRAYYHLEDLDKAIFHLKKSIAEPSIDALMLLAKILSEQGDHLEELRARGMLLELIPQSPNAHTSMAEAYKKTGQLEKAVEHYRMALQKYRKHKPAYKGLWETYESLKDFYEMRQTLLDYLKFFPNDLEAYSKICQVNMNTGFLDEAVEMCRRAIRLNTKNPNNHIYLGLTYKLKENNQQAKKIILTAARQFKHSELAQYEAGILMEADQNWEAALKFYTLCSQADQSSLRCFIKKANLEVLLNQHTQAGQSFLAACRINKSTVQEILNVVGKLRSQNNDKGYYYFKALVNQCRAVEDQNISQNQ